MSTSEVQKSDSYECIKQKDVLGGGEIYHEVYKTLKEVREQSFAIFHSPGGTVQWVLRLASLNQKLGG